MVYEVPASKASIKQNVFEFRVPGVKKLWSLPRAQYLRADLLGDMQSLVKEIAPLLQAGGEPTNEQHMALAEVQSRILDHYCPGLRSHVAQDQIVDILQRWQEFSNPNGEGISLGESSASAGS